MTPAEFRAHRISLGKTQRELAEMLGLRRGGHSVADIESGRWNPSETVALLLQAYVTLCKLSLPGKLSKEGQIVLARAAWPSIQIVLGWTNSPRWENFPDIDRLS